MLRDEYVNEFRDDFSDSSYQTPSNPEIQKRERGESVLFTPNKRPWKNETLEEYVKISKI